MTTTQHTAGPWRVFDAFTDPEIVTDRPTAFETESLVQFKGQKNAKANARLMAAAPDLLAALEKTTKVLDDMAAYLEGCRGEEEVEANNAIDEARLAIAKAKGGAS